MYLWGWFRPSGTHQCNVLEDNLLKFADQRRREPVLGPKRRCTNEEWFVKCAGWHILPTYPSHQPLTSSELNSGASQPPLARNWPTTRHRRGTVFWWVRVHLRRSIECPLCPTRGKSRLLVSTPTLIRWFDVHAKVCGSPSSPPKYDWLNRRRNCIISVLKVCNWLL